MKTHEQWFEEAARVAKGSLCLDEGAMCGSVVVQDERIIGEGYNAPPLDDLSLRRCLDDRQQYDRMKKPRFDLTCCVHAEWRAIMDALKKNTNALKGATLYFVRIDGDKKIKHSGKPFCTVCSRLALDTGIAYFALWHKEGIKRYDTKEYNMLSYEYHKRS